MSKAPSWDAFLKDYIVYRKGLYFLQVNKLKSLNSMTALSFLDPKVCLQSSKIMEYHQASLAHHTHTLRPVTKVSQRRTSLVFNSNVGNGAWVILTWEVIKQIARSIDKLTQSRAQEARTILEYLNKQRFIIIDAFINEYYSKTGIRPQVQGSQNVDSDVDITILINPDTSYTDPYTILNNTIRKWFQAFNPDIQTPTILFDINLYLANYELPNMDIRLTHHVLAPSSSSHLSSSHFIIHDFEDTTQHTLLLL
ncbi:MAG: hypothetical protein H9536_14265, partial [Aphanizomenon flos-aquae Clear-A1]|nr:hypothetical protein [Aphanizomenon flos-aquae Clear-A1]